MKINTLLTFGIFLFSMASNAEILIEAEEGKLSSPMEQTKDKASIYSSKKYKGEAQYSIQIPVSGIYDLAFKVRNPNLSRYKLKATLQNKKHELEFKHQSAKLFEWAFDKKSTIRKVHLEKGAFNLRLRTIDQDTYIDAFKVIPIQLDKETNTITQNTQNNSDSSAEDLYQPPQPVRGEASSSYFSLLNHLVGFASGTTGGLGGSECLVTNLNDSGSGSLRNCVESNNPRWVRFDVSGTIRLKSRIAVGSNTTIDGRGQNITISDYGLHISKKENVILHNLRVQGADDDAIKIYKSHKVWVDHLSLESSEDGLLDITEQSSAITVSWTRLENHNKTMLIGSNNSRTDDKNIHVTLHHNFHYNTIRRNPTIRYGKVHIYNNVFKDWGDGSSGDGIAATFYSQVYIENNIFDPTDANTKALRLTVGSYIPKEGYVRATGNQMLNGSEMIENKPEKVFNPSELYSYSASAANESLYNQVVANAGRQDSPQWDQVQAPVTRSIASVPTSNSCSLPCKIEPSSFDNDGFIMKDKFFYSATSHSDTDDGTPMATTRFELKESGTYSLTLEALAPSGKENSFFVQINDNEPQIVHLKTSDSETLENTLNDIKLKSGENSLTIFAREQNSQLFGVFIEK